MVLAHWMMGPNFGDYLTPWLINKFTSQNPSYIDAKAADEHYIITGSILGGAGPNSIIWGAGFANYTDRLAAAKVIKAVRGPLSRDIIRQQGIICPEVIGDPALLLPRFYKPNLPKRYKLGVIPHWIDYYIGTRRFRDEPGVRIIDILRKPEEIIDEVSQCEYAISSSLHGIIVCHAFGVPCLWIKLSDSICGDGFKYHDYLASVGVQAYKPTALQYAPLTIEQIINKIPPAPLINTDALWDSRPFK